MMKHWLVLLCALLFCAGRDDRLHPPDLDGDEEAEAPHKTWLRPYDELRRKRDLLEREQLRASATTGPALPWRNLGPTSGGNSSSVDAGRLRAIVPSPTEPGTIYIGTSGGGVFRTTNADSTGDWIWKPLTDDILSVSGAGNIAVGDLAISPVDSRTLWLGLGDPLLNSGNGFFVTHDGGDSWQRGGDLPVTGTWKILPLDGNTLLAGTANGLWRSTDGGASFTQVPVAGKLSAVAGFMTTAATSIARFPGGRLLLGHIDNDALINPSKILYSDDGGLTWTAAQLPGLPSIQRFTIATSSGSDSVAYAMAGGSDALLVPELLVTADGGKTWTARPNSLDTGQGSYNNLLIVDDTDPNLLFVGTRPLYRTTDGGQTFEQIFSDVHSDQQTAAWWHIRGTTQLLAGNDGGFSLLADPRGGSTATASHNKGVASHLVYKMGCGGDETAIGMQDDGTRVSRDGSGNFIGAIGGDGLYTIVKIGDPDSILMQGNGAIFFTHDGGLTLGRAGSTPEDGFGQMVPDPGDSTGNTIYRTGIALGLYRSSDFAATFTALGTAGFATDGESQLIAVAPSERATLAAVVLRNSTEAQELYVSNDAGASWTLRHSFSFHAVPISLISSLVFDSLDAQTIYVTAQGGRVLQSSHDQGRTFQPLDGGGYPSGINSQAMRNDPLSSSILYAANEFGIYWSQDSGASWARYGQGLPWVMVNDFCLVPERGVIRAGTFGRGVWEAPLPPTQGAPLAVNITPAVVTLTPGAQQAVTVTVSGPADLTLVGLPDGVTGSFDAASLAGAGSAQLTLAAAPNAALIGATQYAVTATHLRVTSGIAQAAVSIVPVIVTGTAQISSPAEGAAVAGAVDIVAMGSLSSGAGDLRISVDGVPLASDSSLSVVFAWDSTSVADGPHIIAARTFDAAGDPVANAAVDVVVRNTPPDAGPPDAGPSDAGTPDAGGAPADAGQPVVVPPPIHASSGGCAAAGTDGALAAVALALWFRRRAATSPSGRSFLRV
jgi:hypothetical protein